MSDKKRNRRSDDQMIAALEAKIQAVKARAARKRVRGNPSVRHTVAAVRSIDKAAASADDQALRKALEEARGALSAWLALEGVALPTARKRRQAAGAESEERPRRRRRAEGSAVGGRDSSAARG